MSELVIDHVIEKKFIEIDNRLISYQEIGEGEPIVLIHGLGTSSDSWSQNIFELSKCGKVYAVDMPGFGESCNIDEILCSQEIAKVIYDWCRALKIKKATFIGHSFGGEVCLWMAVKHKKVVRAIVLAASTGLNEQFSLVERFKNLMVDGFREPTFFMTKLFKSYWKAGARRILLTAQKSTDTKITKFLAKIKVPVLVVFGTKDPVIIYEESTETLKKISDVTIEVIDATHGIIFESPDLFNQAVCKFLHRVHH